MKELHERLKATPSTWMSEILKKFPPVFHRWFLNRWKDRPAAWHGGALHGQTRVDSNSACSQRLKLKYDELVSSVALDVNARRYSTARARRSRTPPPCGPWWGACSTMLTHSPCVPVAYLLTDALSTHAPTHWRSDAATQWLGLGCPSPAVGHVVGLGDRHGENILLDEVSGDVVHVDFSCLFDKGLELETPEMVPFRLTQNMVDGLGVGGYEGTFMRVCEITLGVLRSHREALMSVLETFVHDPLVEWTKQTKAGGAAGGRGRAGDAAPQLEGAEQMAERGQLEALEKIRSRLEGVVVGVGAAPSLPLSPQGQARRLIEEVTRPTTHFCPSLFSCCLSN